ncbi:hypothetical protein Agub_g8450 [Astrephomene gubernaculifera]|uniref:Uncharacterized protein n=1 Tax=Astrephomene gubernaculifera TaxID=47775 RepID=A0AAD3DS12_9CHLO|nr:hypothetical protein Agub_g8450 [Astrephomene gubernaculifera]
MVNRRSESCPRLLRKVSAPTAEVVLPQQRTCTLQDLGPEDKQKVAKLLKQVVDLGQEVQQLRQQRDEQARLFAEREQELQEGNRQLHKEYQSLKRKLGQVLLVLRASQAKVNALEAANHSTRTASVGVQTELVAAPEELQAATNGQVANSAAVAQMQAAANAAPFNSESSAAMTLASATDRTVFSSSPSVPSLLHVAPGAHICITINHVPEPASTAAAPTATEAVDAETPAAVEKPAALGSSLELSGSAGRRSFSSVRPAAACTNLPTAAIESPTLGAASAIPTTLLAAAINAVAASSYETHRLAGEPADGACVPSASHPCMASQPAHAGVGACSASCLTGGAALPTGAPVGVPGAPVHPGPSHASRASGSTAPQAVGRPSGGRSILVDATLQQFESVPVQDVFVSSQEVSVASPMIVPPSDAVVAAASSLLGWQAQHGFMAPEDAVDMQSVSSLACPGGAVDRRPRGKVLSYDPAIGKSGAFYFVDVAEVAPDFPGASEATAGKEVPSAPYSASRRDASQWQRSATASENRVPAEICAPQASAVGRQRPIPAALSLDSQRRMQLPGVTACQGIVHPTSASGPLSLGRLKEVLNSPAATQTAPQGLGRCLQPDQQQLEQSPRSPCSSTATGSTMGPARQLNAAVMAAARAYDCTDTPSSCDTNLSRVATMLDEEARRRRWDMQPPPGAQQQQAGPVQSLGAMRVQQHNPDGLQEATSNCRAKTGGGNLHASSRSRRGLQASDSRQSATGNAWCAAGPAPGGGPMAPLHTSAGSASLAFPKGKDVTDRYDDSLVDILSQADEELEQQHYRKQQQSAWPQPSHLSPAVAVDKTSNGVMRHRSAAAPATASEGSALARNRGGTVEELLSSNLYEENDVLSVILEQECHN